jgi:hypothetical protein
MKTMNTDTWTRRGINFLWDERAFGLLAEPAEVLSLRAAVQLSKAWKGDLPANKGRTLAVAGLDLSLDLLSPEDAELWIVKVLRPLLWQFQAEYDGEGALVFWIPGGARRLAMNPASERYSWRCAPPFKDRSIELGRLLLGGAEADLARIMDPSLGNQDPDGPAWIGLHHPRLS